MSKKIFTGLRPTGDLTIGNYLGAIKPMVELQDAGNDVTMFVADLHALTDQEPKIVEKYRFEIVKDYLALGVDPAKTNLFLQSAISNQVLTLTMLLSRHITMSELLRVPSLKDKLKDPDHPEQASVMLANYPVMMAADILLHNAETVPVGEDQVAHLEVSRVLARRFNSKYAEVFNQPKPLKIKNLKVLALNGEKKMSKSDPSGAILLSEPVSKTLKKIKRAETTSDNSIPAVLNSHIEIVRALANDDQNEQLKQVIAQHKAGEKVMGNFKQLFADVVEQFVVSFQAKRDSITNQEVERILAKGNAKAAKVADQTIAQVMAAMDF